jgi:hypothetical protein
MTGQVLNYEPLFTVPGMNVATSFAFDDLGRPTVTFGPQHTAIVGGAAVNVQTITSRAYNQSAQPTAGTPWLADQNTSAQGYFDGTAYTIVDPVTITNMDKDGRTLDNITSHRTTGSGLLSPTNTFAQTDWQTWSSTQYNAQHQTVFPPRIRLDPLLRHRHAWHQLTPASPARRPGRCSTPSTPPATGPPMSAKPGSAKGDYFHFASTERMQKGINLLIAEDADDLDKQIDTEKAQLLFAYNTATANCTAVGAGINNKTSRDGYVYLCQIGAGEHYSGGLAAANSQKGWQLLALLADFADGISEFEKQFPCASDPTTNGDPLL